MTNDLNRRQVLTGAAGASAVAIVPKPSFATPASETEIIQLFRQHQDLRNWINASALDCDDEIMDPFFEQLKSYEDQIMARPTTCAADFAAKVIVDTFDGELFPCWETGDLWIQARELVGLP